MISDHFQRICFRPVPRGLLRPGKEFARPYGKRGPDPNRQRVRRRGVSSAGRSWLVRRVRRGERQLSVSESLMARPAIPI